MKTINILLLCSVFFLSCNPGKKDTTFLLDKGNIDSLLTNALDKKNNVKNRLLNANLAYEIIEKNDSIKNENFTDLASVFFELGDQKKYLDLSRKFYKKSIANKDYKGLAESSYCIGNYFYNEANYDSAYFYFRKS